MEEGKDYRKAVGYATVAIALTAAIQAINGFNQYRTTVQKDWTYLLILLVVGAFVVLIFSLAYKAYVYLIK